MITPNIQKFIEKFGFPTLVALLLLGVMIGLLNTSLRDIQAAIDDHDANKEITDIMMKQTDLLKIICRNIARNEFQAAQCER